MVNDLRELLPLLFRNSNRYSKYQKVMGMSKSSFFNPMAGHLRSGVKIDEFRDFTDAAFIGIAAAAVENTTGGKVDGRGNFTF
jgi:hypothetical protein